jgi:hypothetical protein
MAAGCSGYGTVLFDETQILASNFCGTQEAIEKHKPAVRDCIQNFQAALLQVLSINSPLNIVVQREETGRVLVRKPNGKRVPRDRKTTRFIVLPRRAAYELVTGDKTAEGVKCAAHARRRHWRTLRSERFSPERRGTRVCVRECWVGQTERTDGGIRYRVRLDLGAPLPEADQEQSP